MLAWNGFHALQCAYRVQDRPPQLASFLVNSDGEIGDLECGMSWSVVAVTVH